MTRCRPSTGLPALLLALLLALAALAGRPADAAAQDGGGSGTASAQDAPALPATDPEALRALIETLEDPEARAAFVARLEALLAAGQAVGTGPGTAPAEGSEGASTPPGDTG
ncbi:MAG: hypothetical protein RID91_06545, partial [Azospirillaceae bacterium]